MASSGRPERQAPPEVFYNEEEARKYTSNSRMIEIQSQLTERAIELLSLPEDTPCYLLDIGCGSGLSGECLTDQGHYWVGVDISPHMLDVAVERETEGDLVLGDMGEGMAFRPGAFDGVISISALQWLCNADKKYHHPPKRMLKFFTSLYSCMGRGSRAVFQLYPESSDQVGDRYIWKTLRSDQACQFILQLKTSRTFLAHQALLKLELITQQSMRAGFTGGLVVDYPNSTKAKKMFLCLFAGGGQQQLPKGLGTGDSQSSDSHIAFSSKRERIRNARGKPLKKSRDWILAKKERKRRQGKDVRTDTKYTGRKRKSHLF